MEGSKHSDQGSTDLGPGPRPIGAHYVEPGPFGQTVDATDCFAAARSYRFWGPLGTIWRPSFKEVIDCWSCFIKIYIFGQKCTFEIYNVIFHKDFEWNRTSIKKTWKKFPDINPQQIFPILIPNIPLKSIKINPNLLKYTIFSRKSSKIIIIMKSHIKSHMNPLKAGY